MTTATLTPPARQREELAAQLEDGIATLRDSEQFQRWLDVASKFHGYSFSNQVLIGIQCPNASRVAGFKAWQSMGRQVLRGEKAIKILAPTFFRKDCTCAGDCDCPSSAVRFRSVSVFDISQTDGEPLPEIANLLTGDGLGLVERLEALAVAEGLTIDRNPDNARNGANGWYSRTRKLI